MYIGGMYIRHLLPRADTLTPSPRYDTSASHVPRTPNELGLYMCIVYVYIFIVYAYSICIYMYIVYIYSVCIMYIIDTIDTHIYTFIHIHTHTYTYTHIHIYIYIYIGMMRK